MARPTKEAHERRTASLPPVRVTEAELATVQAEAKAAGVDLTRFIRERILTGQTIAAPPTANHSLLVELSRSGNNLNQIARALNRGRPVPDELAHVLHQFYTVLERVGRVHGA
ncbi:plasmid mobilization protein [Aureimonas psammosilenae]|uniref:plasmid mobilization protein n=1 Tax=Aureimonas psammosilenae TaxID=2495496 RepID=UPI0018699376|nr:plasmid mobilization relaxosome protein MobC [Aureimonas psammosilenae]